MYRGIPMSPAGADTGTSTDSRRDTVPGQRDRPALPRPGGAAGAEPCPPQGAEGGEGMRGLPGAPARAHRRCSPGR